MQTSRQQSSILQPRLAACAPGCQGYPTPRWEDATARSGVADCITYRNTIVLGGVPSRTRVPCAWQARAIQPLRMSGKGPFPFRDWQRRALSRQSERPLRTKEVTSPNAQGPGPNRAPEKQTLLPAVSIVKLSATLQRDRAGTAE